MCKMRVTSDGPLPWPQGDDLTAPARSDTPLPAEITVRDSRVWSNVSVHETIALLLDATEKLRANMAPPVPLQRGKVELQA
jgi:hypothetical protein